MAVPHPKGLHQVLSCIYQQVNQHWRTLFMPESKTTKNSTPPTEETSPIEAAKLRMARGLSVLSSAIICTGLYTICLCVLISAIFDLMSRVFLSRAAPPDTFGLIAGLAAIGMIIFSLLALICEIRALYEFSKCKIILPQDAPGIIQGIVCCLILGAIFAYAAEESPALSFFSFWGSAALIPMFIMKLCSHYQQQDLEKKCQVFLTLSFFPVVFYCLQGTNFVKEQLPLILIAAISVHIGYMVYGIMICRTFSKRLKSGQLPEVEPTPEPPKDVKKSPSQ